MVVLAAYWRLQEMVTRRMYDLYESIVYHQSELSQ